MDPDAFTLVTLKSIFDEMASNAQAHAASYFFKNTGVQMASLSMTFDLVKNADDTFGFARTDSANPIQARYAHNGTAGSDLQIANADPRTNNEGREHA
jgi:hypothetical protein